MAKKNGSTQSTKRFTYKSFRDRVNDLKIDPIAKLQKKAFHEAEISHFLSTLEHWKEVNLSKTFTELVEIIEPLCLSLPQLLYHQDKIFESLETSLKLNDELALQPTLELLSQFAHDLGPDFLPFYSRSLISIRELATQQTNPDALEWIFNCLAYIYKYLSKELSKDLLPTFELLFPLLTLTKKEYVTKFAAQATSFLVRKVKSSALNPFVETVFTNKELIEDNSEEYHRALTIIFADSLTSSAGHLHSKASIILTSLTNQCLQEPRAESVLTDVIMDVLGYTDDSDKAKALYDAVCKVIDENLGDVESLDFKSLTNITKLLTTLAFAESGKKVSNWNKLLSYVKQLYEVSEKIMTEDEEDEIMRANFGDSIVQFASVLMRNAELKDLTKKHVELFTSMTKINDGSVFLPFADFSTDLTRERFLTFGKSYVKSFVGANWEKFSKEIAYFLSKLNDKGIIKAEDETAQTIVISPTDNMIKYLVPKCESAKFNKSDSLIDAFWGIQFLGNTSAAIPSDDFASVLKKSLTSTEQASDFGVDVAGILLGHLKGFNDKNSALDVLTTIDSNLPKYLKSSVFLESFNKFLLNLKKSKEINVTGIQFLQSHKDKFIDGASKNLLAPSHKQRELSLSLIISIYDVLGLDAPGCISTCRIIEQIPLTLRTARDLQLRFRMLVAEFNKEQTSELVNQVVVNFMFGQLSNKFKPSWEGVYEFSQGVISKVSELVWQNAYSMISTRYNQLSDEVYFEQDLDFLNATTDMNYWLPQDHRIVANFENNEKICHAYQQIDLSLVEFSQSKREDLKLTNFNRCQSINLLVKNPSVAEKHFESLLPYLLDENLEDEDLLKEWTIADRSALIELLTKFEHLNKASQSIG
ncbi:unnamed protein product [Ambrosiozyma monospora]|uniref:Unnamed protein product n=1 Tax=Ambrosiozyma monospora TaxID=43982 RepID=A0ACB5T0I4_AMBMO|nr:unnamed protein product [Ambrosiozyma monospora]